MDRIFSATEKNKIWVGDITYIPTKHSWLYLAVFIDIFSRKVVGWSMDTRIRGSLVLSACYQAIGREHPPKGPKCTHADANIHPVDFRHYCCDIAVVKA